MPRLEQMMEALVDVWTGTDDGSRWWAPELEQSGRDIFWSWEEW